jgi:hypothetical protein
VDTAFAVRKRDKIRTWTISAFQGKAEMVQTNGGTGREAGAALELV